MQDEMNKMATLDRFGRWRHITAAAIPGDLARYENRKRGRVTTL